MVRSNPVQTDTEGAIEGVRKKGCLPQGGGGYSGFQVTGMIEEFFGGLKSLISGFFGVGKFWQVFFWVA